jgi:hypothetical protein
LALSYLFGSGIDLATIIPAHSRASQLCAAVTAAPAATSRGCRDLGALSFLQAIAPFRDGLVVACECLFCWYWLADLCQAQNIAFVLGHALYMEPIHGGKAADDRFNSASWIARKFRTPLSRHRPWIGLRAQVSHPAPAVTPGRTFLLPPADCHYHKNHVSEEPCASKAIDLPLQPTQEPEARPTVCFNPPAPPAAVRVARS